MMTMIAIRNARNLSRLPAITSRCCFPQTNVTPPLARNLHQAVLSTSKRLSQNVQARRLLLNNDSLVASLTRLVSTGPKGHIVFSLRGSGKRFVFVRYASTGPGSSKDVHSMVLYIVSLLIVMLGLTYAAVPAYKVFCRQFGLGGNTEYGRAQNAERVATMNKVEDRVIKVRFSADTAAAMTWRFKPQQAEINVLPGETALAFYSATNPTERPVIGISTYSVSPPAAALYFNKIQCFCFEEQILNPGEQVDLPVFFYIDPDYDEDLELEFTDEITLSYTFFEAREGLDLPLPGFVKQKFEEPVPSPAT